MAAYGQRPDAGAHGAALVREGTDLKILARESLISAATAYLYLHEAIDVIAEHAPDLHDVLAKPGGRTGATSAWTRP